MNKKLVTTLTLLVLTAALLLSVPAARADVFTVTLATPSQTGFHYSTLDFYGTIDAPMSNTDVVYLNSDVINLDPSFVTDDSGFFFGAPTQMNPGDSYTGLLFSVFIDPSVVLGDYVGSYTIDGADAAGVDVSSTADFNVNAVPEPSSLLLLASGALGLVGTLQRKTR